MQRHQQPNLVTTGTAIAAAASKTPFRTAFMITLGIGAAQCFIFLAALSFITGSILLLYKTFQG